MGSSYEVRRDGLLIGVYSSTELRDLAGNHEITSADEIRRLGEDRWYPIAKVRGLQVPSAPPESPPVKKVDGVEKSAPLPIADSDPGIEDVDDSPVVASGLWEATTADAIEEAVNEPAAAVADDPFDEAVEELAAAVADDPFEEAVEEPTVDVPADPFAGAVEEPVVEVPADPFADAVEEPAVDVPADPFGDPDSKAPMDSQ